MGLFGGFRSRKAQPPRPGCLLGWYWRSRARCANEISTAFYLTQNLAAGFGHTPWKHGLAPKERRLLAHAVPFHSTRSERRQRGAARARVGSARVGPRSHRERAQWRASALHAQPTSRSEGQGWHVGHGLAPKERRLRARTVPFHSAWREFHQRGAARARVGTAHAGPLPHRERAQWRASALHAKPTSQREGQGWNVGARPGA